MYAGRDFISTTPNEIRFLTFDFQDAFVSTDSISSAVWTSAVAEDSTVQDPTAASRIGGPFQNSGRLATATLQQCVIGVRYLIKCVATAVSGQKAEFESYIDCLERQ